jgi:hypothetical protein
MPSFEYTTGVGLAAMIDVPRGTAFAYRARAETAQDATGSRESSFTSTLSATSVFKEQSTRRR